LVGKTPKEAAQIAGDLYTAMQGGGQMPSQQPQYQQNTYQPNYMQEQQQSFQEQQQSFQQPQGPQMPSQDDWDTNPQGAMQQYLNYVRTNEFQPALNQQWSMTGSLALSLAQQQHKDAFDSWGPEIMQLYNQLDPQSRANPQNIGMIVDMVRGRHVKDMEHSLRDQITKDLEAKFASGGSLRPDTATGSVPSGDPYSLAAVQDELPPGYKETLARHGVDDAKLTEFLLTKGRDLYPGTLAEKKKAWLEEAKKEDVITERPFRMGSMEG
jgi:hypothetical protein